MRAILLLLLCASVAIAADNVRLIPVPPKQVPMAPACVTNVVISGVLGPPAQYAFLYPSTCPYSPLGVNYQVGGCSLSGSCTNLSANSIIVSNAQSSIVGIVTIQTRNGNYSTNLALGSGFTGGQFYWGLSCQSPCTNCTPFICRVNDTGGGN